MQQGDLKKIRRSLGLSQIQLAEKLNVTQATVSRIESGKASISTEIAKKLSVILSGLNVRTDKPVISKPAKSEEGFYLNSGFEENYIDLEKGWNAYQVTAFDQSETSDLVIVRSIVKHNKAPFLIGDMTGHGSESAYMAFAIRFSFESFLGLISPTVMSVELVNSFIAMGIKRTKKYWRDNPSIITGVINQEKSEIEFINNGMPYPLLLSVAGVRYISDGRQPAIDINSPIVGNSPVKVLVSKGDSLIFFSDGLLDFADEEKLIKYANEDLKYFKGDSRAIGRNLLRMIKSNINKLRDDVSFLVISLKP